MTYTNSEDNKDVLLFKASELGDNLFYETELTHISLCSMRSLNIVFLALEAWMHVDYLFWLPQPLYIHPFPYC